MSEHLNIAIVGSRGIPVYYGGFETFAEMLAIGLVERGHNITVYCPSASSTTNERSYRGVQRVIVPTIKMKSFEKISSSFISCMHAAFRHYDIILFLGVAPAMFAWLPRITGKKLVMNIDGQEWKRRKWGEISAKYLKISEQIANIFCHAIIADSRVIQEYIKNEYQRDAVFIAYGAVPGKHKDDAVLAKYGLREKGYFLQVCRLEPENNADIVIREYNKVVTDMPLVILGDAPYADEYKKKLHTMAGNKVKFLGGVYGHDYNVLRSCAFTYIHAHEVGGTNPSLLEALAAGNCVIVLAVPYNLEVIGNAGLSFTKDEGSLKSAIEKLLGNPQLVDDMYENSVKRIEEDYTWASIISKYEDLFCQMSR
ncbi:MAG: DUF1972 domain-containing protein [Syntrophales bacterium]|jgi:glycosyltransferase involved in cell wall biosynthesis